MSDESVRRAEEVGEIARALGVEHRVVSLEWGEGGRRRTEAVARHRRYPTLMEECRKVGARVLMVGHSQDDQIGMWKRRCLEHLLSSTADTGQQTPPQCVHTAQDSSNIS